MTLYREVSPGTGIGRVDYLLRIGEQGPWIVAEDETKRFWFVHRERDSANFDAVDIVEGPCVYQALNECLAEVVVAALPERWTKVDR